MPPSVITAQEIAKIEQALIQAGAGKFHADLATWAGLDDARKALVMAMRHNDFELARLLVKVVAKK